MRAALGADFENVGETLSGQKEGGFAFALEQRIGGDGGAHFDGPDCTCVQRVCGT